jgi:hypothetical protein
MLNPAETLVDLYTAEEWDTLLAALANVEIGTDPIPVEDLLQIYDDTTWIVLREAILQVLLVRLFEIGPQLIDFYTTTDSWTLRGLIVALFCLRPSPRFFPFLVTEYLMTPPFRDFIEQNAFSDPTATLLSLADYVETNDLNAQQEAILMDVLDKIPELIYAENAPTLRFMKIADLYHLARARHITPMPRESQP